MGRQIHVRASVGMRKGKLDTCLRGYGQASATHPTHSSFRDLPALAILVR